MQTRVIPSTGDLLPAVGLGTYRGFDVASNRAAYQRLPAVLDALFAAGGSVIDSSPMYGKAEETVGRLLAPGHPKPFLATKVWTSGRAAGIAQMEDSFRLLRTECIDLLQIHNLVDWKTHLPTLRKMKEQGRIRYIGVTHYTASAHAALEAVITSETIDFVQINYSLDDRAAARRLLPLARDRGVAVICNYPFGGGGLLRRLHGKRLPAWAPDVGASGWAQLALRFLLSNPAVTCVIPGTGNPENMAVNAASTGVDLTRAQIEELVSIASR